MDMFPDTPADADTEALLALLLPGGAVAPRRDLLDAHGTPAAVRALPRSRWRGAGLDAAQIRALDGDPAGLDPVLLARCRDWLRQPGHHLIGWHDPDYPPLLRRAGSPPLALFVAGDPSLLWHPAVAVVGSRGPTAGGRDNARAFSRALAAAGFAVGSGLAAGVDRAAHEAALEVGGITIAVLGTGPDVPYPQEHAGLMARIATEGAVVSEHPPGTAARREHFPSRNRILAGLSLGTLVIEAAGRSGALITARLAADAGREVFAVPGSIHNPMARGCHRLIRDGAALVESADEVIAALGTWAGALRGELRRRLGAAGQVDKDGTAAPVPAVQDDPAHHRLWRALGHDPSTMDQLAERTGLTAAALSSMLLNMELQGRVAVEHGRYSRR
ncbi:DNA-processing protein DprA [Lysobacter hankyongensis]|uniref:DNA-processing protein DprA n=2 Tax=Lysobacter hankyongensis TaxID=1176535 RepID=A0ABP9B4E8_9GAMM